MTRYLALLFLSNCASHPPAFPDGYADIWFEKPYTTICEMKDGESGVVPDFSPSNNSVFRGYQISRFDDDYIIASERKSREWFRCAPEDK
jgi:hypothetical protein